MWTASGTWDSPINDVCNAILNGGGHAISYYDLEMGLFVLSDFGREIRIQVRSIKKNRTDWVITSNPASNLTFDMMLYHILHSKSDDLKDKDAVTAILGKINNELGYEPNMGIRNAEEIAEDYLDGATDCEDNISYGYNDAAYYDDLDDQYDEDLDDFLDNYID